VRDRPVAGSTPAFEDSRDRPLRAGLDGRLTGRTGPSIPERSVPDRACRDARLQPAGSDHDDDGAARGQVSTTRTSSLSPRVATLFTAMPKPPVGRAPIATAMIMWREKSTGGSAGRGLTPSWILSQRRATRPRRESPRGFAHEARGRLIEDGLERPLLAHLPPPIGPPAAQATARAATASNAGPSSRASKKSPASIERAKDVARASPHFSRV